MAGPSTVAQCDSLIALRMQLLEAGAGDVAIRNLLDLPQHANPHPTMQHDIALACDLVSKDLAIARDAALAHRMASHESEHSASANMINLDVMLHNPALPPLKCPVCLELVPPASRFLAQDCGHAFCAPCIRRYLSIIAAETRQFPLPCPTCRKALNPQSCLELLAGTGSVYNALERLIIERQHYFRTRYCSNPACAIPFDWEDDPSVRGYTDEFKVTCPLCAQETCVQCKVKWHEGQTCEQHSNEKQNTDAFVHLARRNQWQPCPNCGQIIDRRQGDCNFVKCLCGCGFCHKCGKEYLSLVATTENGHGRPDCSCGLFGGDHDAEHLMQLAAEVPAALPVAGWPGHQPAAFGDMRDELDEFVEGVNGYIGLSSWLRGVGEKRKCLPVRMACDVRTGVCPYPECHQQFRDLRSLQLHLANVRRHEVFLCCGRPFVNENSYNQHRNAVHN